jgi:aminoglycoside 3-N-acetyltransferase I
MTSEGENAGFTIRRLFDEDLDLVYDWRDMFNTAFGEPAERAPSSDYMRRLLSDRKFVALAALKDGHVIGGIAAYELVKYEQERSELYIYDLAVAEPFRRRRVATSLIEALKPIACAKGAWMMFVQADRQDEPAVALYRKLGSEEEVLHFDIAPK